MSKIKLVIILIVLIKTAFSQTNIIKGTVISESKTPIAYANVWVKNTSIGTITNSQGQFVLKIPEKYNKNSINISYIGYSTFEKNISQIPKNIIVILKSEQYKIPTVEIVTDDFVESVLKKAYLSITDNYPTKDKEYQVFYQEKLSHKDSILYIAESILQANKGTYQKKHSYGQIKIIESRKYENIIDTINRVSFAGGPYIYFSSDNVKTRSNFLKPSKFKNYKYTYKGAVSFNNSDVYVIDFKDKKSDLKGTLYIDKNTFAYNRITKDYSNKKISLNTKTTHTKSESEYFKIDNKMYLKYLAIEFDITDLTTKKNLKANVLFITSKVKDKVNPIPYKQELLFTDIYRDKLAKSTESNWENYNVLKEDTVFLSQKYFLDKKYSPKETLKLKDYINKYSSKIYTSFYLGILPVSSNAKNYSLLFSNNDKIYKSTYQAPAINIAPTMGFSVSYLLTRHHNFSISSSKSVSEKYFASFFNINYSYLFKFNKMGKPIFFQPTISYSIHNTGAYTGDFIGENNISVNKSTLNSEIISSYIGNKEQGVSLGFSISVPIAKQFNFFINSSYFYNLESKPILVLRERNGFYFFRKTEYVPMDNNIILKEDGVQVEKSSVLPNNIVINIGFSFGINTN